MAQLGVKCPRGYIGWEECLTVCAHNPLRPCDYSADMLNLLRQTTDGGGEPGAEAFTPTRLLGCPRQSVLMGEYDYYVDVDQAYPAMRGNMVHSLMEKATYPGAVMTIREQRFHMLIESVFGPMPFSAKPDLLVVKDETDGVLSVKIVDYKSTNKIDNALDEAKLEHQLQINMYAWIAETMLPDYLEADFRVVVDELEIIYCAMENKRRFTSAGEREIPCRRKVNGKLVDTTMLLQPIRMWESDKVGRYIQAKITERLEARHVRLPDILEGDAAWLCRYCPVRDACYEIGNVREEDEDE